MTRKALLFSILLLWTQAALADEPRSSGPEEIDVASLPKDVQERLAWLHPGMKWSEVNVYFAPGTLASMLVNAIFYVVTMHHKYLAIGLTYQPFDMPDDVYADQTRSAQWWQEHSSRQMILSGDILRTISKPYLAMPSLD